MRSRRTFLAVLLMLALALPALAETVPYAAIYASDNPVPEIARRVRPAVVQVIQREIIWSPETGEVSRDTGSGSAVYVDEQGYFITNKHVVEGADEVVVVLLDGTEKPATVVGMDAGTDIAVIKVEGGIDAEPVELGDSDALVVGELAIAIGNPGSGSAVLRGSVTAGIISALDRENITAGNFGRAVKVIQTDAAINAGISGGALLSAKGQLIGIPTLKYMFSLDTVYEGLGFAIPINTVRPIMEQLIEKGKVVRPRLGITVMATEGPARPLKNYAPAGVMVVSVEPASPAALAGMLKNDIILSVDGARVKTINELTSIVDDHAPGDTMVLEICRYYDSMTGEPLPQFSVIELVSGVELLD